MKPFFQLDRWHDSQPEEAPDSEGNIVLDEIVNLKLESGNYGLDTYYQHP